MPAAVLVWPMLALIEPIAGRWGLVARRRRLGPGGVPPGSPGRSLASWVASPLFHHS